MAYSSESCMLPREEAKKLKIRDAIRFRNYQIVTKHFKEMKQRQKEKKG